MNSSGQGSLWTTPVRVGEPPLPEAKVEYNVTREDILRALERVKPRLEVFGGRR